VVGAAEAVVVVGAGSGPLPRRERRLLLREACARLRGEDRLAARFLRLERRDLGLDRREQVLALVQHRLDLVALRREVRHRGCTPPLGGERLARGLRVAVARRRGLDGEVVVGLRDRLRSVEPVEQVGQRRAAEQDGDRRFVVVALVEGDQPGADAGEGDATLPFGDAEIRAVDREPATRLAELVLRAVPRLHGEPELPIERADLCQHGLRLGGFGLDALPR